ncbi:hypothetical protein F0U44_06510 [Nocardioides humilatus]|uniref:Uncharacterized protein n=1 Tax=Nocardioides humilatus TaxID=2607660 RepID=A0A5B1LN17_9ACTN|nr:hypothetical protein [Nocardioides humilatus]KAA1421914.1 hypothetical protein F0U44_06510 [Nocardioides humilatus]
MTYDARAALAAIDDHTVVVLAFFAVVAVATFTYLVSSFRTAYQDRAYSCALPAVGWFAVHDLGFVLQYDQWFHTYDHWWVKGWWVALIATSLIELALVGLVVRYGHAELAPHLSRKVFALGVWAGVAAIGVLWILVKRSIDDDLYLISFPITAFWAVPFGTALMLRRGSRRGQSALQPACVAVIVVGFQGALWFVDDFFRSWEFLTFTVMAVGWSLANIWLIRTLPAWSRSAPDVPVPVEAVAR